MAQRHAFAPEGHLRLAQRFIAGSGVPQGRFSPGGTIESDLSLCVAIVPPGLDGALKSSPSSHVPPGRTIRGRPINSLTVSTPPGVDVFVAPAGHTSAGAGTSSN